MGFNLNVIKDIFNKKTGGSQPTSGLPEISPFYKIKISSSKHASARRGQAIKATAPRSVQLNFRSEWETLLSGGNIGGTVGKAVDLAAGEFFNVSGKTQKASAQVWSGNSPIELTIPFELKAKADAKSEVVDPILKLGRMVLPGSKSGSLLSPPGPRVFQNSSIKRALVGRSEDGDIITIVIGSYLVFHKVILTAIDVEFFNIFSTDGYPMKANVSVTFRTMYSLISSDLNDMFNANSANVGSSNFISNLS